MFTIIYEKETGKVVNITSKSDVINLKEAIPETNSFIFVEELPQIRQFRQILAVEKGKLITRDLPLTDEQKKNIVEMEKNQLRDLRQRLCFTIINQNFVIDGKSKTWFETLTAEQQKEADAWVKAWRDVTEDYTINSNLNEVIPETPKWLK